MKIYGILFNIVLLKTELNGSGEQALNHDAMLAYMFTNL